MRVRTGMVLGIIGVTLGWGLPGSQAAPPPRIELCHFQEETGTWKLLTLPLPATLAHTRNHDDAFPGGATFVTGTVLDDTCAPVGPTTCPCEGVTNPPAIWSDAFPTATCTVDAVAGTRMLLADPASEGVLQGSAATASCSVAVGTAPAVEQTGLSTAQVAACDVSLQAIAAADAVVCIELQGP